MQGVFLGLGGSFAPLLLLFIEDLGFKVLGWGGYMFRISFSLRAKHLVLLNLFGPCSINIDRCLD